MPWLPPLGYQGSATTTTADGTAPSPAPTEAEIVEASRILTGHIGSTCCHTTGGRRQDGQACECQEIAREIIAAIRHIIEAKARESEREEIAQWLEAKARYEQTSGAYHVQSAYITFENLARAIRSRPATGGETA